MRFLPDNFRFEEPLWFWGLLLIPILAFLRSAAGRQSVIQFGSLHLLRDLGKRTTSAMGPLGFFLVYFTIAAAVTALARPQKVTVERKPEESGVEIFIALDLSFSMSIKDMFYDEDGVRKQVDRLTVAKNVTKKFIRGRPADRIGYVVFAGKPYVASPLTLDKNWLEETLERDVNYDLLVPNDGPRGMISTENMGTAIGSAIASASSRLARKRDRDKKTSNVADTPANKVIILVTDGANNAGKLQPLVAAKEAAALGIRIYTVAIGTYGKYVVPELVKRQLSGDTIRQEFDEQTLKDVAATTNGRFYHAKDGNALANIFTEIDRLESKQTIFRQSTQVEDFYHWPLWVAVGNAILTLILHQTLLRRYP